MTAAAATAGLSRAPWTRAAWPQGPTRWVRRANDNELNEEYIVEPRGVVVLEHEDRRNSS
jgi:hypothetical protein